MGCSCDGVVLWGCSVAVVVGVVGVVSAAVVLGFGLLCLRGVPRIILSICRCVRRNLFSSSCVIVHEGHAYSAVGVTVPWNSLSLSRSGYVLVVSSRFR